MWGMGLGVGGIGVRFGGRGKVWGVGVLDGFEMGLG